MRGPPRLAGRPDSGPAPGSRVWVLGNSCTVCMHTQLGVCVFMHVAMYMYVYVYISSHVRIYTNKRIYIFMCVCTQLDISTCVSGVSVDVKAPLIL